MIIKIYAGKAGRALVSTTEEMTRLFIQSAGSQAVMDIQASRQRFSLCSRQRQPLSGEDGCGPPDEMTRHNPFQPYDAMVL